MSDQTPAHDQSEKETSLPYPQEEIPRQRGLLERLRSWKSILSAAPLSFLGLGVYRAWIEIAFVGTFIDFPTHRFASHDAFDLVMIGTLFVLAALHSRLTPLHEHRWSKPASVLLLILSTVCGFVSIWKPGLAQVLAWPSAISGGIGIAIVILLWSELYARESPVRICLLYSLSLVTGALIIYAYRGFRLEWLPVMVCLLPVVSMVCLSYAYRGMPRQSRPAAHMAEFSFPWKPIAVVGIYSFAFGLQETQSYAAFGPHSSPGTAVCALVIIVAIVMLSRRVEFETIYGSWLPFLSAAFLLLPVLLPSDMGNYQAFSSFSANFGYTASEIFVMTMIGSICYHYGASAIWLFGIERGVRALAMLIGRRLQTVVVGAGMPIAPLVMIAVLAATFMVFSEKRLDSAWGVRIQSDDSSASSEVVRRNTLVKRCSDLARQYSLTQREEEVLILLAEHKTAGDIEHELLIARGTAKAHIGHVYQKLGIHSREELFEITGVANEGTGAGAENEDSGNASGGRSAG